MSNILLKDGPVPAETEDKNEKDVQLRLDGQKGSAEEWDDVEVPWLVKWISLAAVIALPMGRFQVDSGLIAGVNWSNAALGPLKNTLRKELGINNEQFGVISSADAIVNS